MRLSESTKDNINSKNISLYRLPLGYKKWTPYKNNIIYFKKSLVDPLLWCKQWQILLSSFAYNDKKMYFSTSELIKKIPDFLNV